MYKQFKSKLLFIPCSFLVVTLGVTGCNNEKKEKAPEEKTNTPAPPARDSIDTANEAPGNDVKPVTP